MADYSTRALVSPCGRDIDPLLIPDRNRAGPVYAADASMPPAAPSRVAAARRPVHSPRAARCSPDSPGIAASSASRDQRAAAEAAGAGLRRAIAAAPRDEALLEVAATLCQTVAQDGSGARE